MPADIYCFNIFLFDVVRMVYVLICHDYVDVLFVIAERFAEKIETADTTLLMLKNTFTQGYVEVKLKPTTKILITAQ